MNTQNTNNEFEYDFSAKLISVDEGKQISALQKSFIDSYLAASDMSVEEWLPKELGRQLPDYSQEEIEKMSHEIISSLKTTEEKKVLQEKAIASGQSKESWLSSELMKSTSQMSVQDKAKYLQDLDDAVKKANEAMVNAITGKAGLPNQNMNLDGFIADQHHVDTYDIASQAQNRNLLDADWNEYTVKDIALKIVKQTGFACLQNAAAGAGMSIASKVWHGESFDGIEAVKTAISSGMDFGIKTATAGALKTASEKGILNSIPKGSKGNIFADISFIAVENARILSKIATGEISPKEGLELMEQTTSSCVAGWCATKGAAIGTAVGTVLGPVGAAVGGFVGGSIGYIAGSKVGKMIIEGAQKVRKVAMETIKSIGSSLKEGVTAAGRAFASLFGF